MAADIRRGCSRARINNTLFSTSLSTITYQPATVFGAADSQPFTLTERMIHQNFDARRFHAVNGNNFPGCAGIEAPQKAAELSRRCAEPGRIFSLRLPAPNLRRFYAPAVFFQPRQTNRLRNLLMAAAYRGSSSRSAATVCFRATTGFCRLHPRGERSVTGGDT